MTKQQLFIEILNDLEFKINSKDQYQILKASELIRSLMFDASGSLIDKINKDYSLKILFEYKDISELLNHPLYKDVDVFFIGQGLYPPFSNPNSKIIKTKKDDFLKAIIVISDGKRYSVKDILNFSLYKLGGTHHEEPKSDDDKRIAELNGYSLMAINSILYQIIGIGNVVISALYELKNKVIQEYYS